jgi:hypothetical protein
VQAQDQRSCPSTLQEPDKTNCCDNLNKQRSDFSSCCEYPILVVYRDDYDECTSQCTSKGQEGSRCCILSCCFKRLGILGDNITAISPEGLSSSFKMSVKNPDAWSEKIGCVVNKCTANIARQPTSTDKASDEYKNYWDCFEQIPMYFYDIVDCAYDYNL